MLFFLNERKWDNFVCHTRRQRLKHIFLTTNENFLCLPISNPLKCCKFSSFLLLENMEHYRKANIWVLAKASEDDTLILRTKLPRKELQFSLWPIFLLSNTPTTTTTLPSLTGGTCFCICCFWSHVAAVTMSVAMMLSDPVPVGFALLWKWLYLIGIMLCRTFRSGLIRIM